MFDMAAIKTKLIECATPYNASWFFIKKSVLLSGPGTFENSFKTPKIILRSRPLKINFITEGV